VIGGFSSRSWDALAASRVGRLSLLELISQVVVWGFVCVGALLSDVWALAIGRIVSEIVRTALSYWMMPEGISRVLS